MSARRKRRWWETAAVLLLVLPIVCAIAPIEYLARVPWIGQPLVLVAFLIVLAAPVYIFVTYGLGWTIAALGLMLLLPVLLAVLVCAAVVIHYHRYAVLLMLILASPLVLVFAGWYLSGWWGALGMVAVVMLALFLLAVWATRTGGPLRFHRPGRKNVLRDLANTEEAQDLSRSQ